MPALPHAAARSERPAAASAAGHGRAVPHGALPGVHLHAKADASICAVGGDGMFSLKIGAEEVCFQFEK